MTCSSGFARDASQTPSGEAGISELLFAAADTPFAQSPGTEDLEQVEQKVIILRLFK